MKYSVIFFNIKKSPRHRSRVRQIADLREWFAETFKSKKSTLFEKSILKADNTEN